MKRIVFTVALAVLSLTTLPARAIILDGGAPLDPAAAAGYVYAACGEIAQRILEPTAPPTSPTACGIEPYHGHLAVTHFFGISADIYARLAADATLVSYRNALQVNLTAPGPGDGTAAAHSMRVLCEQAVVDTIYSLTAFHGWHGPQAAVIAVGAGAAMRASAAVTAVEANLAYALNVAHWDAHAAAVQFGDMVKQQIYAGVLSAEQQIGHGGHAATLASRLMVCVPLDGLYVSFLGLIENALGSGPPPI